MNNQMKEEIQQLINDITAKRELNALDNKYVEEIVLKYFDKRKDLYKKLQNNNFNPKNKDYKLVIKEIRKDLREVYGVFIQTKFNKKNTLLDNIQLGEFPEEILKLHQSTKERLPFYKIIYKHIFGITGQPNTIMDLACGLNPLSYHYLGHKPEYYAYDISSEDMDFVNNYFKREHISGEAQSINLIQKLPDKQVDVCFLFKAIDTLETNSKNIGKEIIDKINSKWIIASFPKISIGGNKTIAKEKRNWFSNFLNKKYEYTTFEVQNEYFFIIKK